MSARPALRRYSGVVPVSSVQGTLALDLQAHPRPVLAPPTPVAEDGRSSLAEVVTLDDPRRRRVEAWAQRYAQAAVEIVCGDRPAAQLVRWTRSDVYSDLIRRAQLVGLAAGRPPGHGRPRQAIRPQVVSVRACAVSDDVWEVCVRVRHGKRYRAVAARFELLRGRLQCTALEFA